MGPALGRLLESARAALAAEAAGLNGPDGSRERARGINRRLLGIVHRTMSQARHLAARIGDLRLRRKVQMTLNLPDGDESRDASQDPNRQGAN